MTKENIDKTNTTRVNGIIRFIILLKEIWEKVARTPKVEGAIHDILYHKAKRARIAPL